MIMYKTLHPRDDVDRLWIKKRRKKRTWQYWRQVWGINTATSRLHRKAWRKNEFNTRTKRTTITRKQEWDEKQLYGRFERVITNISEEKTWTWLKKGNLRRETATLIITAENNAIWTNPIKGRIDKTQQKRKCRLCRHRRNYHSHSKADAEN